MGQLIESLEVTHSGGTFYIEQNDETHFALKKTASTGTTDYLGSLNGNIITLSAGGLGVSEVTSINWLS